VDYYNEIASLPAQWPRELILIVANQVPPGRSNGNLSAGILVRPLHGALTFKELTMARKALRFPKSITIHLEISMMTAIEKAAIQNDRDPEQEI
jgi:hypothetical protein